jgi:hypothetical protein
MAAQINLLNWTGGHGCRFTHDWFKFPGKFHPPLVEHILRSLKPKRVLDPMGGVGTVAVEAKAAGIPSLSLDVDPVSVFFARAKTTPISAQTLSAASEGLSTSLQRFRRDQAEIRQRQFRDIRLEHMRDQLARLKATDLADLTYWFRRYVLVDFARIDHSIWNGGLAGRSDSVRRFFLACLLSSVRRISFADPTPVSGLEITHHMRDRIAAGYLIDVFSEFERRVRLALSRMDEYVRHLRMSETYGTPAKVLQADCADILDLRIAEEFGADLILFSPPYCNAIEYWRRHRLEYFLGGFLDLAGVADLHRQSIGRTTLGEISEDPGTFGFPPIDGLLLKLQRLDRRRKARVLWRYFDDMRLRLLDFHHYLPRSGHCIIVVGDSSTGGLRVPTARTLEWLGIEAGFRLVATQRYRIKNRVMQFPVNSNSKIEQESIIVLRKP